MCDQCQHLRSTQISKHLSVCLQVTQCYAIGRRLRLAMDMHEKSRQIARGIDCHVDAAVQRGSHCPMEHIQGFT